MKKLTALFILCIALTEVDAQIHLPVTPTNISCFGGRNGAVSTNVSGGTSPYTYLWSTGATTSSISALAAGYYVVTVTDATSATASNNATLTEPTALTLSLTPSVYNTVNNISCPSCCNGFINISAGGGTTSYSYAWSSSVLGYSSTSANISNLCKGIYTLTITDANGCTITDVKTMSEPDKDTWTMTGNGGSNASTNFIGTTDNRDFVFKTNNSEALRIKANGNLKIGYFSGGSGTKLMLSDSLGNIFSRQIVFPVQPCFANIPAVIPWIQGDNPNTQVVNCYHNFGIATPNPQERLEVAGTIRVSANGSSLSNYINIQHDGGSASIKTVGNGSLDINCDNGKDVKICIGNGGGNTEIGGDVYLGNWGGKVGIGTNNPKEIFQIGDLFTFHSGGTKVIGYNHLWNPVTSHSERINTNAVATIGFDDQGAINFKTAPAGITGINIDQDLSSRLFISNNGNIGIGTSSPGALLDVSGNAKVNQLQIANFSANQNNVVTVGAGGILTTSSLASIGAGLWQQCPGTSTINYSSGAVGIGTCSPKLSLDIRTQINVEDGNGSCVIYCPNSFYFRCTDTPDQYDATIERMIISADGTFQLFAANGDAIFKVNTSGYVGAKGVKVTQGSFPDYVFKDDYPLMSLHELEDFIKLNKHLPEIPTACEVEDNGLDLGEMQTTLVKKIEELTLYVIELKKENEEIKNELKKLKE